MATPLLFLIADTGGGHRACAAAVAERLDLDRPGEHSCHIVDPFVELSPRLVGSTTSLYGPLTLRAPWLWGALYHATNSHAAVQVLLHSALRLVIPGLDRLVAELKPAAIISFHPLLNHVASLVPSVRRDSVPTATVVTDLVNVHASWLCPAIDAVVVPTSRAYDSCRRAGLPPGRCHDLGLPVGTAFSDGSSADARAAARASLELPRDAFIPLLCGGAEGSGGLVSHARRLTELDIHLAVICGRNGAAADTLTALPAAGAGRLTVRGFVTNMAEWMRAADVVVTKAGPHTIAEALCSGSPLLLSSHLPGQERGNVDWVVDNGAGAYVPRPNQLLDTVSELASPGSDRLARLSAGARRAARPDAARLVATFVADLAAHSG